MEISYANLSRAQLTYEYLHTNSTTHEFLFGALAELVDNSRDADATELKIHALPTDKFRGGYIMSFLDDGCGMDPVEVSQVIQFGRSSKREAGASHIGQYGNGLKSGSMRIGRDMILFTKKGSSMSCLFLSRTFHETEDIREVIVPMPSWHIKSKSPYLPEGHTKETHDLEVDIITKYSPFKSEEELMKEFDKIPTHGTNVLVFNLKLMDNGDPELIIDENDIKMADPHAAEVYDIADNVQPERISFRAYASVLYCEPRMKVYIQDTKVRTKKIVYSLYKPRAYLFTSNRFKRRSEAEAENAEKLAKIAEEKAKELATQAREANMRYQTTSKDDQTAIRLAVSKADQAKFDADIKKRIAEAKRKSAKEPKTLTFTFGFNIDQRRCDGLFVYNCNRLIRFYEKVGPQQDGGVKCAGLVGVVDVPYLVLEPTHNKQDFADQKEYKHLLRSMADHMAQYWKDSKIETTGITKFWDDFGYTGSWRDDPSADNKYKMKRKMSVPSLVQCNTCLKWRQLQFSRKNVNDDVPHDWTCSQNTDSNFSNCSKPEQKIPIPSGKLQKDIKNIDNKRAEEVRKLQERLDKKTAEIKKNVRKSPSSSPSRSRRKSQGSDSELEETPTRGRQKAKSPLSPPTQKSKVTTSARKNDISPSPTLSKKKKINDPSPSPAKESLPPKRGRKAKSPSPPPKRTRKAISPTPPSRSKRTGAVLKKSLTNEETIVSDENHVDEKDVLSSSKYTLNCKVEAEMHNTWYPGIVVAYKKSGESGLRVRVKFEKHSHDKFDKWFYETDSTLRLRDGNSSSIDDEVGVNNHVEEEPDNVSMLTDDVKGELLEKVTYLLRRCLCYFRAPDFEKDKKEILALTPQQLRDFPLSNFFDDYERNIRKQLQTTRESLNRRADEAEKKLTQQNLEKAKLEKDVKEARTQASKHTKTLKELRLGVNVMLRSILNEDEKLDPNDHSENVDIYLKTIVDQISESGGS